MTESTTPSGGQSDVIGPQDRFERNGSNPTDGSTPDPKECLGSGPLLLPHGYASLWCAISLELAYALCERPAATIKENE